MTPRRSRSRGNALVGLLVIVGLVVIVWLLAGDIARAPARFLDIGVAPEKADAAVVLAGGWSGERVLAGADLVKQGFVPLVLLSGPKMYYERPECDYSIPYAVEHGYPAKSFACVPMSGVYSTRAEAEAMLAEIHKRGLKKILLVTSNYHTRRATRFFRKQAPGVEFVPIAVPPRTFQLDRWYEQREGWKTLLLEWTKLVTSLVGI